MQVFFGAVGLSLVSLSVLLPLNLRRIFRGTQGRGAGEQPLGLKYQ
jgi:hypothetical protein